MTDVSVGNRQALMADLILDDVWSNAGLGEVEGVAMAEPMRVNALCQACTVCGTLQSCAHVSGIEGLAFLAHLVDSEHWMTRSQPQSGPPVHPSGEVGKIVGIYTGEARSVWIGRFAWLGGFTLPEANADGSCLKVDIARFELERLV
jgi:hypothetical protein